MEHYIFFDDHRAKFIIPDIECDFNLVGFIPLDLSLPIKELIPIKYVGDDKIFLHMAQPMIDAEADAIVLGDTYYILRAFRENDKYLLALCRPVNPIFPSQAFDGKLFLKEFTSFPNDYFSQ